MARFRLPKPKLPKLPKMPGLLVRLWERVPITLPDHRDPLVRRKLLIYALIGSSFGLIVSMAGMGAVNFPRFCSALCHSQDPEYQAWKQSAHANIGCKSCHTPDGSAVLFLYDEVSQLWKAVLPELLGDYEKPINAHNVVSQGHMPNEICLRCHSPETRKFTPTKGLKMDGKAHETHLEKGVRCTTCHNRVTHAGAEKFEPLKTWIKEEEEVPDDFKYKNFVKMTQGCFRCHKKGRIDFVAQQVVFTQPDELDKELHPSLKPVEDEIEHEADENLEALFHGSKKAEEEGDKLTEASRNCVLCHTDDFDLKPKSHQVDLWAPVGVPAPGPERTRWKHADAAKADGPAECYTCHLKKFCLDCHGTEMPHPKAWSDRHGIGVQASVRPEPPAAFFVSAPFARVRLQFADVPVVKDGGGLFCYRCHSSENFCKECHGLSFPHPPGWRGAHGRVAQAALEVPPDVKLIRSLKGAEGMNACETCHRPQFCSGCHGGVTLPHPPDWLTGHRLFLKDKEASICLRCHAVEGCERCHAAHQVHNKQRLYDFSSIPR